VQLFFLYFGLPELGIHTDPVITSIIALGINSSAGNCEVIRSGLMAVKEGFYESSYALGFSRFQTFQYIIFPIALRIAFKPLTSNFINLILTSSVAFSITVNDLMGASKTVAARTARPFEVYIFILVAYCIFTFSLSFLAKAIDRKISINL
jgi:polar amino acid transport system permease protein/putative glutamine transport system permease protein